MKDFFEELGKYIGETATIVGNKAGEVIETQKLKSQVRSLTHENTVDLLERSGKKKHLYLKRRQ